VVGRAAVIAPRRCIDPWFIRVDSSLGRTEIMKRTMRMLGVTVLALCAANSALAENANQRVVGKKGIGYYSSDAPVGVRYWVNDGMAIDFGVGLGLDNKIPTGGPNNQTTSLFDWAFDIGMPWVLHGEENMIVYFRPGVTFNGNQILDTSTVATDDKVYDMTYDLSLGLGGEFFLGQLGWPNLSFSGQVGVGLKLVQPGASGADSSVNFFTKTDNVSVVNTGTLGFHFYF
jgi:hypothetical protein